MVSQYLRQHTAIDVGAAEHDGNAFPRVKRALLNGRSQCGGAGALRGVVGVFVERDAGRFGPGMPLRFYPVRPRPVVYAQRPPRARSFNPRARAGRDRAQ